MERFEAVGSYEDHKPLKNGFTNFMFKVPATHLPQVFAIACTAGRPLFIAIERGEGTDRTTTKIGGGRIEHVDMDNDGEWTITTRVESRSVLVPIGELENFKHIESKLVIIDIESQGETTIVNEDEEELEEEEELSL